MTDNNNDHGNKTKWSRVEELTRSKKISTENSAVTIPIQFGVGVRDESDTPPDLNDISPPDFSGVQGIVARWQQKGMSTKVALQKVQLQYDAYLDTLGHFLKQAVRVRKTEIDQSVRAYLLQLDEMYAETMAQLEVKNMKSRIDRLVEMRAAYVAKLNEVQKMDWPANLIDETIEEMNAIQKRVAAQLMQEMGRKYSND